jgi:hypothetical protein
MQPLPHRPGSEEARAWSGGTGFVLFLAAHLVLDLALLVWGATAYSPPPGGCRQIGCAADGGEWFHLMALIVLLPGVLGGAALSSLVQRLLYGSVRLPRPGWLPRLTVIPPLVLGFALAMIFLVGEP